MKIHIVKQGDTLYELSKKYGVPLDKLIEANPQIANPDVLAIGDKVKIPSAPVPVPDSGELFYKHTVKQGDTLWKLSKAWGIQLKDMIQANPQLKNPDVLKIGDIVNVPKKAAAPAVQPKNVATAVSDKTTPGGKTYTGPIEQPAPPAVPVPIPEPIPAPVTPVNEPIHTETQSLFVQISVPAQEAVSLPPMPEPPKEYCAPEPPKEYCGCEPVTPCHKSYGYPGITENPNYYDCPPAYPLYEAIQPTAYTPYAVQPAGFIPEVPAAPYCYPEAVYPVADVAAPSYPGGWPGYTAEKPAADFQPYSENSVYAPTQYGIQPATLPWPSCGCGDTPGIQPYSTGYDAPAYGTAPVYTNEAQYFPYGMGFPQPYMTPSYPVGAYGSPVTSGIPPIPEYPGQEEWAYSNRIPGETQEAPATGEASPAATGTGNLTESQKPAEQGEVKAVASGSAAKVKISSQRAKDVKQSGASKPKNSGKHREPAKKRRNPWISN